jgi:transposase-like protein
MAKTGFYERLDIMEKIEAFLTELECKHRLQITIAELSDDKNIVLKVTIADIGSEVIPKVEEKEGCPKCGETNSTVLSYPASGTGEHEFECDDCGSHYKCHFQQVS